MLSENDKYIILMKDEKKIKFDTMISMPHVAIYRCNFHSRQELGAIVTESRTEMSIQHVHALLRHCNEEITRKILKYLG